jgi:hypothetical protein
MENILGPFSSFFFGGGDFFFFFSFFLLAQILFQSGMSFICVVSCLIKYTCILLIDCLLSPKYSLVCTPSLTKCLQPI